MTSTGAQKLGSKVQLGYGAMAHTWTANPSSEEKAFAAFKAAIEGGSTFFNSGEFYAQDLGTGNLELLKRFFDAEPDLAKQVTLSVKGGLARGELRPDSSLENLRASCETINKALAPHKMDMFETARIDKTRPIEELANNLKTLRDEGHFKYVSLSEVSAKTIRTVHSIVPVSAVEIEYSPWSLDIESNGILATCEEFQIPIVAYSPLGRGMLTGTIKKFEDLPENDMRRHFDRFQPENFANNYKIVEKLSAIAERKGCTPAQLTLAWLCAQSPLVVPIPGSTRAEGVTENIGAINVTLSPEDLKQIREVADSATIIGGRYNAHMEDTLTV